MALKIKSPTTIYDLLEKDCRTTMHQLGRLYEALSRLRHEGKMFLGRNVAEIRELAAYFKKELNGHMKEEERTLFPFLRTHIPRLEPMVYLLTTEHEDFRRCLEVLDKALGQFRAVGGLRSDSINEVYEQGTYLICLLRSHMRVESTSLYKAADEELRPAERAELIRQIKHRGARICDHHHRHSTAGRVG